MLWLIYLTQYCEHMIHVLEVAGSRPVFHPSKTLREIEGFYSLSASTVIGASFSANQEVVKIKSSEPKFCE